jgi:hypothetical protein
MLKESEAEILANTYMSTHTDTLLSHLQLSQLWRKSYIITLANVHPSEDSWPLPLISTNKVH